MKGKTSCPLSIQEWIQFLSTESTLKRHDYYNEEVSILTRIIILLTAVSAVFVMISILNDFSYIPNEAKVFLLLVAGVILIVILLYFVKYHNGLLKRKKYEENIVNLLGDIICEILNGTLTDSNAIKKRYMDIWDKELWKKEYITPQKIC
jgi:hypothetical protein